MLARVGVRASARVPARSQILLGNCCSLSVGYLAQYTPSWEEVGARGTYCVSPSSASSE